ncbi:hypothetical protein D9M69_450730 [compost metagenome]
MMLMKFDATEVFSELMALGMAASASPTHLAQKSVDPVLQNNGERVNTVLPSSALARSSEMTWRPLGNSSHKPV